MKNIVPRQAQPSIMFRTIIHKQTSKARSIHPLSYNPHTSRVISTFQPRRNTNNNTDHDNGNHHYDSSQHASPGSLPAVSWKEFAHLDKDVSNIKLKLDHIQAGQAEMRADIKDVGNKTDRKIDRIFYAVITTLVGFILKGGFEYYNATAK